MPGLGTFLVTAFYPPHSALSGVFFSLNFQICTFGLSLCSSPEVAMGTWQAAGPQLDPAGSPPCQARAARCSGPCPRPLTLLGTGHCSSESSLVQMRLQIWEVTFVSHAKPHGGAAGLRFPAARRGKASVYFFGRVHRNFSPTTQNPESGF